MLGRVLPALVISLAVTAASLAIASCSVSNQRIGIEAPPFSKASFAPLGDYLVYRCGTIDCHGSPARNFRVYGCDGMRLDAGQGVNCARDDAGGGLTSVYEYQATYRSMVGLEPQLMTTVWSGCEGQLGEGGTGEYPPPPPCHPELLTMVRKARGIEKHKGGQLICLTPPCPAGVPDPSPYDLQDVCIVSWLEGAVNQTACGAPAQQAYGIAMTDAATE